MSENFNSNQLTLFPEASPARMSRMQDSEPESTENTADSGLKCSESFASYDRSSSLWRTSQLCLDGALAEFSETWPRAGMTRNGTAYQLRALALLTAGTEFGLWPTPRSEDSEQTGPHRGIPDTLTSAARMWPTPTEGDAKSSGSRNTENSQAHFGLSLTDAVREDGGRGRRWPTPTADDANNVTRNSGDYQSLSREVYRSPSSRDWKGMSAASWRLRSIGDKTPTLPDQVGGALNPEWVAWLMGFPVEWLRLELSEMRSSRRSRNGSEEESRNDK